MSTDTDPNVFLIESNSERDEKREFSEGKVISGVLNMMGKKAEYRYIRTRKELKRMLEQFAKSRFRYLHIACHGGDDSFALTLDNVNYHEFAAMARATLTDRRVFLSACEIANNALAREVYSRSRPYSITGPTCEILFSDAAAVWAYCIVSCSRKIPVRSKEKRSAIIWRYSANSIGSPSPTLAGAKVRQGSSDTLWETQRTPS